MTLLLLSGCGESPTGPAGEHVAPTIGARYHLQLERVEIRDGVPDDRDTVDIVLRVVAVDPPGSDGDVYGFLIEEGSDSGLYVAMEYLDNGDVRYVLGVNLSEDYILPFSGAEGIFHDTIDGDGEHSRHAVRYEGTGTVVFDGRVHDASIVRDVLAAGYATHGPGYAFTGVMTTYYVPALGFPVVQRMEIGELDDQGNLIEVEAIATLTLLRIEE